MDRYSHAGRDALPRAIRQARGGWPSGLWHGPAPGYTGLLPDGGRAGAPGEGSGIEVGPEGQAVQHRVRWMANHLWAHGLWRVAPYALLERGASRLGPGPAGAGTAPVAPLRAAFRLCGAAGGPRETIRLHVPARGGGGLGSRPARGRAGAPPAGRVAVPMRELGRLAPSHTGEGLGAAPMREDAVCLERLARLRRIRKACARRRGGTLYGLAGFVCGPDDARPGMLRLGTVIVGHSACAALFPGTSSHAWSGGCPHYGGEPRCQNMCVLGGVAFLRHPGVPHGRAYAMSSARGPAFVHGDASMHFTGDGLGIYRGFGIADPPPGPPGCPWGVMFGAERAGVRTTPGPTGASRRARARGGPSVASAGRFARRPHGLAPVGRAGKKRKMPTPVVPGAGGWPSALPR